MKLFDQDLCNNLRYGLNPRVHCAFGNVFLWNFMAWQSTFCRVFFFKGPTQKSSKYGTGPSQQVKIAKYTGPTQSYQRSEE